MYEKAHFYFFLERKESNFAYNFTPLEQTHVVDFWAKKVKCAEIVHKNAENGGGMREMHARKARCRKNADQTVLWVVLIESPACLMHLKEGGLKASE